MYETFRNLRYRKDGDFLYTSYDSVTGYHILRVTNIKKYKTVYCITKEIKEKKTAIDNIRDLLGIAKYEINWGGITHKSRMELILDDIKLQSNNNRKSRQGHRGKGDY